ncbi:DUF5719 family protein [Microbacterium sp. ASV81]|uniref:DUF5719 family protein n=1 Tax=Microbacterium capsulatum TaxID=3041921 RepID=A0ABU0XJU7_9MICO|nr:DUF5719 family protein [Microbacterium sp. ASV81]MDQ4215401.1 DUF5719 family protein [Microbacterium sp. ASV81]
MTRQNALRIATTGARLVAGAVVSAACVVAAVVAVPAAWPTVERAPAHTTVKPVAGDTLLTCAGPFRALGRDASRATELSTAGTPSVVSGAAPGSRLAQKSIAIAGVPDARQAPMFTAAPNGQDPAEVAAAESLSIAAEDLAGFAASACRPPSMESWIVGGAGTTGSNDILLIANPGAVTATVTFTEYGSQGGGMHTTEVVVPAGTQSSIPLAAGAAGEATPVVRVTSSGAAVRAALQSSLIRTLDPVGIDVQDAIARPSKAQSLLGVRAVVQSDDDDNPSTAVRLLAPSTDAIVMLQPRNAADGTPAGAAKKVQLTAGQVGSVDFSALKAGLYSIDVTSTAPVVAAAWETTGLGKGSDFAWMTPAPDITGSTAFAVADGPAPLLHLQNASTSAATVEFTPVRGGATQRITLAAGGAATVPVAARAVYALSSPTAVRAAVSYYAEGKLAGYPVWPTDAVAAPIAVYQ